MKCSHCGGEVSSQSISCPFCGSPNPEGIAFQKEVKEKIERNRLLKPFLIKQKTPELVQKMLTRIWVILIAFNMVLFLCTFFIYLWSERDRSREIPQGSHAESFVNAYGNAGSFWYDNFWEQLYEVMDCMESGVRPEYYRVERLVEASYDVWRETTETAATDETEDIRLVLQAFFRGYLGFSEEEMDFLAPDAEGNYGYVMPENEKQKAIALVFEKWEVTGQ